MAGVKPLVDLKELDLSLLSKIKAGNLPIRHSSYDKSQDTLILSYIDPSSMVVSYFLDDNIALLYNPKNKVVTGFQIENLKEILDENSAIMRAWSVEFKCDKRYTISELSDVLERKEKDVGKAVAVFAAKSLECDPVPA